MSQAIASPRAAQLYDLPTLATDINDYPDNCTRFWVLGTEPSLQGTHTALAFSRNINLSRIESRPTKRSLGEYLFFMDLESSQTDSMLQDALTELGNYTEVLKVFGSYFILSLQKLRSELFLSINKLNDNFVSILKKYHLIKIAPFCAEGLGRNLKSLIEYYKFLTMGQLGDFGEELFFQ